MNSAYEGKTAQEWIGLLETGDVEERCAAALVLADLDPDNPAIRPVLVAALKDQELSVQGAAQAALGLVVQVTGEHRRKMRDALRGGDGEMVRAVLQSFADLVTPDAMSTAPQYDQQPDVSQEFAAGPGPSAAATRPQHEIAPANPQVTDIAVVTWVPWLLLVPGIAVVLLVAWVLRGIWWDRWAMAGLAAAAGLVLVFNWMRRKKALLTTERFRARVRFLGCVSLAGAGGFFIALLFPLGTVIIDNECGANVRLLVDGGEWLTIGNGESKRKTLSKGRYRLTVQMLVGDRVLDEHDIEVSACERYVLNVLGAQTYFQGKVKYNSEKGSEMKMVTSKWFFLSDMDYLFKDPPQKIPLRTPFEQPTKTFITKGKPPDFK
jgi:hypothetical protein